MNSKEFSTSLKERVKARRKSIEGRRKRIFQSIKDFLGYKPSKLLNIAVFFGLILMGVISHFSLSFLKDNFDLPALTLLASKGTLVAIHAGIGTIILGLLIFVAEGKRDNDNPFPASAILRETKLYPLAIAEIIVFIGYFIGVGPYASLLPLIGVGLGTIYALHRTIKLILNEYLFHQKQQEVIKDRFKQSIDQVIEERIGNNILRSLLAGNQTDKNEGDSKKTNNIHVDSNDQEKEILLSRRLSTPNKDEYYLFKTNETGVISDIDINALREFAEDIEDLANENGYVWDEGKKIKADQEYGETPPGKEELQETEDLEESTKRYLLKTYHDEISDTNQTLFCIDKRFFDDDSTIEKFQECVDSIFTMEQPSTFEEKIKTELSIIKDITLSAIEEERIGKIERMKDFYLGLTEVFLTRLKPFLGGGFSFSRARLERRSLGGGWDPVDWIHNDINDLYQKAKGSDASSVITEVLDFPLAIVRQSIRHYDHYLFQTFIPFARFFYKDIQKRSNGLDKDLSEISWRKLKNIVEYSIKPKIKNDDVRSDDKEALKDYVIYIYKEWQEFLKVALEFKNFDDFERMLNSLDNWFKHFTPSSSPDNARILRYRLQKEDLDSERKKLEEKLESQQTLEEIEKEFEERKNQMIFGFASRLLDQMMESENSEQLKTFFHKTTELLPLEIEELTELYLDSTDRETIDFWGWDHWILPTDEQVHFVSYSSKLRKLYVAESLRILENMSEEEIKDLELPYENREFAQDAGEEGDLTKLVNRIEDEPEKWEGILPEEALNKLNSFRRLLVQVRKNYQKEEKKKKRQLQISQEKVDQFRADFVQGFRESVNIRSILARDYDLFVDRSNNTDKTKEEVFGIKRVEDKGAFIDDWHIHYTNWGRDHGRKMARSEDKYLINELSRRSKEVSESELSRVIKKFEEFDKVFILSSSRTFTNLFLSDDNFIPEFAYSGKTYTTQSFEGVYRIDKNDIPVFNANFSSQENNIIVLNANKCCKLIQYTPLKSEDNPEFVEDYFYINVRAYSQNNELLEETLNNPPDWLSDVGNKADQKKYLEENVLVEIYQKFELREYEGFEGYKLHLSEVNN